MRKYEYALRFKQPVRAIYKHLCVQLRYGGIKVVLLVRANLVQQLLRRAYAVIRVQARRAERCRAECALSMLLERILERNEAIVSKRLAKPQYRYFRAPRAHTQLLER